MAHKDIRKPFPATHPTTGETRYFEAVGFLTEGESPIYGDEMLERVPGAIGEEDGKFLDECDHQVWSQELRAFYLATAWRYPGYPRCVRYFYWSDGRWDRRWSFLDDRWDDDNLVVRRIS